MGMVWILSWSGGPLRLGGRGTVDQPGGETEPAGGPGQDEGEGDGDEERHDRIQTLLGVP